MTLREFLEEAVPVLVLKFIVMGRALKVCSSISPDFTEVAASRGFLAYTWRLPGHVVNVVEYNGRVFQIDLSAIQFRVCEFEDDETALDTLMAKVILNPFAAIRIRELPEVPFDADPPRGPADYSEFWNPLRSYEFYKRTLRREYPEYASEVDLSVLRQLDTP